MNLAVSDFRTYNECVRNFWIVPHPKTAATKARMAPLCVTTVCAFLPLKTGFQEKKKCVSNLITLKV